MQEELIKYPTAKLAKEKGFNVDTSHYFVSDGTSIDISDLEHVYSDDWNKSKWVFTKYGMGCFGCEVDNKKYFEAYSRSTQALLQKWLREVHNIHVYPVANFYHKQKLLGYIYNIDIFDKDNIHTGECLDGEQTEILGETISFKYEEVLEIGLLEALKTLPDETNTN